MREKGEGSGGKGGGKWGMPTPLSTPSLFVTKKNGNVYSVDIIYLFQYRIINY